jgi:hypothetical protein
MFVAHEVTETYFISLCFQLYVALNKKNLAIHVQTSPVSLSVPPCLSPVASHRKDVESKYVLLKRQYRENC